MMAAAAAVAVAELPAELWMIVLEKVVEAHAAVVGTEAAPKVMMRRFLAKMAVSKLIMRLVRESEALGPIGRIRCTLEDVPTAIAMFKSLTVLWVMGAGQAPHAPAGPVVDAARRALERAGRLEELVSDLTDQSKLEWFPLGDAAGKYRARCQCWDTRPFDDVVEGLNNAKVTDLTIDFLGDPTGYPDLCKLQGLLRIVMTSMDMGDKQSTAGGRFESPTTEEIVLAYCSLERMPPVVGFPGLLTVELEGCVFSGTNVLHSLAHTRIESLIVTGCEGIDDGSPIARMPSLKSLVMTGFGDSEDYPEFGHQAIGVLTPRLLSGELTGRLCKVIVNRLKIERPERLASAIVQCADDCCRVCDCKQSACAICEELDAE